MTLEPCGGCQVEISPKAKACPYCGFQKGVGVSTIESLVFDRIRQGWNVTERRGAGVVIERGEKIRHLPHIFMTVITFGLWGIVYGSHLLFGGLKRRRIEMHRGKVRERSIR